MPTYEYECMSCKHRFEVFQSMTSRAITKCQKCGKKVKKLIGAGAGIIFKGSGFYATDYRKATKKDKKEVSPACSNCTAAPSSCPQAKDKS